MKKLMISITSLLMVLSMAGLASASVAHVSPLQVYDRMELDPSHDDYIGYLIDVRTPEEWCGGDYWNPIPGKGWNNSDGHPGFDGTNGEFLESRVFNISYQLFSDTDRDLNPWFEWEFQNRYDFITDELFALICHSGSRSLAAVTALDALGYDWEIYNVVGGFNGRQGPDSKCFAPFCDGYGYCPGWIDSGLPYHDPLGEHTDPWVYQDPISDGAYSPVPIPGNLLLLGLRGSAFRVQGSIKTNIELQDWPD